MSIQTKLAGLAACLHFDNRVQLAAARTIFRRARFVSHRLKGIDFVSDQQGGDECGLRPCLVEGMYTPFLDAMGVGSGDVPLNVADIGANAGGFALIFAVKRFPVRRIASVEMNPLTFARMQLNVLTAFGPRSSPINAAICERSGQAEVAFTAGGTGEGLDAVVAGNGPKFSVRTMTLDQFLDSEFPDEVVDVMKLDVEGSEWDILDSGTCKRLCNVRFLLIEVHPRDGRGVAEFDRLVASFGFRRLTVRNASADDVFCYANESVSASLAGS